MSFRCDVCGNAMADGQKPAIVVRKIRKVNYTYDEYGIKAKSSHKKSEGFETVFEERICPKCAGQTSVEEVMPYPKTVNIIGTPVIKLPKKTRDFQGFDQTGR